MVKNDIVNSLKVYNKFNRKASIEEYFSAYNTYTFAYILSYINSNSFQQNKVNLNY